MTYFWQLLILVLQVSGTLSSLLDTFIVVPSNCGSCFSPKGAALVLSSALFCCPSCAALPIQSSQALEVLLHPSPKAGQRLPLWEGRKDKGDKVWRHWGQRWPSAFNNSNLEAPLLQRSEPMEFFLPLGLYVNCFHFLGCETERDTQNVLTLCCWQAEKLLCFSWAERPLDLFQPTPFPSQSTDMLVPAGRWWLPFTHNRCLVNSLSFSELLGANCSWLSVQANQLHPNKQDWGKTVGTFCLCFIVPAIVLLLLQPVPRATSDHLRRQTEQPKSRSSCGLTFQRPLLCLMASVDVGRSWKRVAWVKNLHYFES